MGHFIELVDAADSSIAQYESPAENYFSKDHNQDIDITSQEQAASSLGHV